MTVEARWVGREIARRDALEKASGKTKFASDMVPDNLLWVATLRSKHPHARILKIDVSKAAKMPGVVGVFTHRDVPNNRYGVFFKDRPVLCDDRVRYIGDPVALVAAESREEAEEAVDEILVEYEPLPVVSDPLKALDPASFKIHENGNVCRATRITFGDVEKALQDCKAVVENTYRTMPQIHAYLETEAGVSYIDDKGRITVVAGGQSPYRDHHEIVSTLNLPADKVRVVIPNVGGAFGGKDDISVQIHLALVTWKTGRPARLVWSREESTISGTKRHSSIVKMKTGASADGKLTANYVEIVYDTGAYAALGPAVLDVAIETCNGPYKIPNIDVRAWLAYTNNMVASAFRGFGAPQVHFAMEQQVDQLAEELGFDPLEFRLLNCVRKGDYGVFRNKLVGSVGISKCLETLKNHRLWRERASLKDVRTYPWVKRGVGVAAAMKGYTLGALPDKGSVGLELRLDGGFTVKGSFTEIGQGVVQAVSQLAAELLKTSIDKIEVVFADTAETPDTSVTSASRQLFLAGNALRDAVNKMLERIGRGVEMVCGRPVAEVHLSEGYVQTSSGIRIPLTEVAETLERAGLGRSVVGVFDVPRVEPIPGSLEIPHLFYMFGAALAVVEVNVLTGVVSVNDLVAVADVGRAINPQTLTGQLEGAAAQGIGYALLEDVKISEGRLLTTNLSTYLIPSIKDVPEIEAIAVEDHEDSGPFGAKGIGEIGIIPVAPAIANAIYDAVRKRPFTAPMTPERVYWLVKKQD
ncbi:MAG: xanthine dehydrogenase family protein molybdopterin-binding subunit [Candidatus Caldarchaeum sp.]|nr:xanthine dehydrogenase family protein molybdopterin-binding subunit [Candidatus Caldarchaeum sp.]